MTGNPAALRAKAHWASTQQVAKDEGRAPSLSEALATFHAHATEAQQTRNGRELTLFEAQPERFGHFFDLLVEGNYRETAAAIGGLKVRVMRLWLQQAEEGDPRYEAFAQVVRTAEAIAESAAVRSVRAAGKDPRFWAAEMTYLERKYPDRWGRRQEEVSMPRVVVQIGATASDMRVAVLSVPMPAGQRTTDSLEPGES